VEVWEVDQLRPEPSRPEVLRSDDGAARVITMVIRSDVVQEHEGYEHGWLMVLDGALELTSNGETREVGPGMLVHFEPYEQRRVVAKTDTTVIYLLAPWPGPGHPSTAAAREERRERSLRREV
jgi:quercetin dioxygenase-like cupin family protein